MPRVIQCEGCQQSHLIRDELVGRRVLCDCGRVHSVPAGAPSVPAPTGVLDAPVVQLGSLGLLLVSVLVLGGVIAWVVGIDVGRDSPKPTTPEPPKTTKPKPPTTKPKPPPTTNKKESPKDDPKLLALLKQLKAPDLETNEQAVKEMMKLDDAIALRAIPAVIAAAERQDNENFRRLVVDELKGRGAPLENDYGCLKVALRIPHPGLQRYVTFALKGLGSTKARRAMDIVVEALKHRDTEVRSEAFDILKKLGPTARVPAFRLLLKPSGVEDEEASLGVLKTLLGESMALTEKEADVLAEALRDEKRPIKTRRFAVVTLGEGKQAARAVPALLNVLREKGDAKLLTLSIEALGAINDKRKEVLTSLRTLAASAGEEEVRLKALQVLEQLDSSALSAPQILERWTAENSRRVKQELDKMLRSRLARLKPEQLKEQLPPLFRHKDKDIVLASLNVVQDNKAEAADVAREVAELLKHDADEVREAALNALESIGPAANKELPNLSKLLLERWAVESAPAVQKALTKLLDSRLSRLKREQMKEQLSPLLEHKDKAIVLVGLSVVRVHKEEAADVTSEVAKLLTHKDAKVRTSALNALDSIGPDAGKALPNLCQLLLDHRLMEKDPAVRRALADLLQSQLARLKREQIKEQLLPVLRHKEKDIVMVGLKCVQAHKEEAADVAAEVADLLNDKEVCESAMDALKALGTGGAKALPKLFEILGEQTKYRRTSLTLTIAGMIDPKDSDNVERLVPFLLEGLHPEARNQGKGSEAAINEILVKIGPPAVQGCFTILNASVNREIVGGNNLTHRKKLYGILAMLGPTCRSKPNYAVLKRLRDKELKKPLNKDLHEAAGRALSAMYPD